MTARVLPLSWPALGLRMCAFASMPNNGPVPRDRGKAIERREFIKTVCFLVGTLPTAAYAQQVRELRLIGVLGADATVWSSWTAAFVTRLRELGWTTGDTRTDSGMVSPSEIDKLDVHAGCGLFWFRGRERAPGNSLIYKT
jgi:hypothetical protein